MSLTTSKKFTSFLAIAFLVAISSGLYANLTAPLSGTIYSIGANPGIIGLPTTSPWLTGNGVSFSWNVTQSGSNWNYSYTFALGYDAVKEKYTKGSLSHLLIEVSDNFTESNIKSSNYSYSTPALNTQNNGNPYLPDPLFSIKFETFSEGNTWTVNFTSDRRPMDGSFYAKGGNADNSGGYVWNANAIAVPNTISIVPAPGALLLAGLGGGLVTWIRRKK